MRDTRGLVTRGVVFYIEGKHPISKSFKVHRLLDKLLLGRWKKGQVIIPVGAAEILHEVRP